MRFKRQFAAVLQPQEIANIPRRPRRNLTDRINQPSATFRKTTAAFRRPKILTEPQRTEDVAELTTYHNYYPCVMLYVNTDTCIKVRKVRQVVIAITLTPVPHERHMQFLTSARNFRKVSLPLTDPAIPSPCKGQQAACP